MLSFETNVRGANTFLKRKYNSRTLNLHFDRFPSVFPTFSTNKCWWRLRASFLLWKAHPGASPSLAREGHVATMSNHKANEKLTKMVSRKYGDEITESHNAKNF